MRIEKRLLILPLILAAFFMIHDLAAAGAQGEKAGKCGQSTWTFQGKTLLGCTQGFLAMDDDPLKDKKKKNPKKLKKKPKKGPQKKHKRGPKKGPKHKGNKKKHKRPWYTG